MLNTQDNQPEIGQQEKDYSAFMKRLRMLKNFNAHDVELIMDTQQEMEWFQMNPYQWFCCVEPKKSAKVFTIIFNREGGTKVVRPRANVEDHLPTC